MSTKFIAAVILNLYPMNDVKKDPCFLSHIK